MIKKGDTAPDFSLQNQSGEQLSLDTLTSQGSLILYFYPIDFSPICTAQACALRDRFEGASVKGIQIVGVSPQSVASHKNFAATHKIPFPLLADPDKKVIRAYGVEGLFGMGTRRATFLIGADKVVQNRVVSELLVSAHTDMLAAVVADV